MTTSYSNQVGFRGRSGDTVGLNVDSGWAALQNTNFSAQAGTTLRARFEVQEENSKNELISGQLEAQLDSGGWFNVTTSSGDVQAVASGQFNEGDTTTDLLTASAKTFVTGYGSEDGLATSVSLNNEHTEFEYCIQLLSAGSLELRLAGLNNYAVTLTITVTAAPVTGSLSQTFGDMTQAGTGTVDIDASLDATLGDMTQVGAGTVGSVANEGTLSVTFDNMTIYGRGTKPLGELIRDDFEEGDFSDFNATLNNTDMLANNTDPMVGNYDLRIYLDGDQTNTFGRNNLYLLNTNVLQLGFLINLSGLSMADGDNFILDNLKANAGTPWIAEIYIIKSSGDYTMQCRIFNDLGGLESSGAFNFGTSFPSENIFIRLLIKRSTTSVSSDGVFRFWVDGAEQTAITDLDNYDRFNLANQNTLYSEFGATDLEATTLGYIYLDNIIFRDDDVEIPRPAHEGSLDATFGDMTCAGTGTVVSGNTGTLAVTFDNMTQDATCHVPGEVLRIDLEEGDFSDFGTTSNQTDMSVDTAYKKVGSYGLQVYIDGAGTNTSGTNPLTNLTDEFGGRFYFKFSSPSYAAPKEHAMASAQADGSYNSIFGWMSIRFKWDGTDYQIGINHTRDQGGWIGVLDWKIVQPDVWYCIEYYIKRESYDGGFDGIEKLWFDEQLITNVTNWDNWNLWATVDEYSSVALTNVSAGDTGYFYFDDVIYRDDGQHIGPEGALAVLDETFDSMTCAGTASTGAGITGSLSKTFGDMTTAGTGTVDIDASTDITFGNMTLAGTGTTTTTIYATLGITFDSMTQAGVLDVNRITAYIDFEEGDFSDLDSTANSTDMAVNGTAAMEGSYGLAVTLDGAQTPTYGQVDYAPFTNAHWIRYYFNPNSISMATSNEFYTIQVTADGTYNGITEAYRITLEWNGSVFRIWGIGKRDGGGWYWTTKEYFTSDPANIILNNGINCIEFLMKRESYDGGADGELYILLNGRYCQSTSIVDNWNVFPTINGARFGGVVNMSATDVGTLHFDDIYITNDDIPIGPNDHMASLIKYFEAMTVDGTGTVSTGNTGILSTTFGDMTQAGTGQVDIEGNLAGTFENMANAGVGTVDIEAALASTFGDMVQSAQGAVDIDASLDATFENMTQVGSATSANPPITATLSTTFGDMTQVGTSEVQVKASSDITYENMIQSAQADALIDADADITFGNMGIVGIGTVDINASLSVVHDNMVLAGAGTSIVSGSLSSTFEDMSQDAQADVIIGASADLTFEDMVNTGAGTVDIAISLDSTYENMVLAGFAASPIDCFLDITFDDMAVEGAAVGLLTSVAVLNTTFADMSQVATGKVDIDSNLDVTFGNMTSAGTGKAQIQASADISFDSMNQSGAAKNQIDADADISFGDMGLIAQGLTIVKGTLDTTFGAMTQVGTGAVTSGIVASLDTAFGNMGQVGTGKVDIAGLLDKTFENMAQSADGSVAIDASTSFSFDAMTLAGAGAVTITGSLDITFGDQDVDGSAASTFVSTASLDSTFEDMAASGAGKIDIEGSLFATFEDMEASGLATVPVSGSLAEQFFGMSLAGQGKVIVSGQSDIVFEDMEGGVGATWATLSITFDGMKMFKAVPYIATLTLYINTELSITSYSATAFDKETFAATALEVSTEI